MKIVEAPMTLFANKKSEKTTRLGFANVNSMKIVEAPMTLFANKKSEKTTRLS